VILGEGARVLEGVDMSQGGNDHVIFRSGSRAEDVTFSDGDDLLEVMPAARIDLVSLGGDGTIFFCIFTRSVTKQIACFCDLHFAINSHFD
jgi:hypothetical protein